MEMASFRCSLCDGSILSLKHKEDAPLVCSCCGNFHFLSKILFVVGLVVVYEDRGRFPDRKGLLCVHSRRKNDELPLQITLHSVKKQHLETLEQGIICGVKERSGLSVPANHWRYVGVWSVSAQEQLIFLAARRPMFEWHSVREAFKPNSRVEDISPLWFDEENGCDRLHITAHKELALWFITEGFFNHEAIFVPK